MSKEFQLTIDHRTGETTLTAVLRDAEDAERAVRWLRGFFGLPEPRVTGLAGEVWGEGGRGGAECHSGAGGHGR